ncbi:MAG: MFS transporter [Hyphomicrobiaceae bacterium]
MTSVLRPVAALMLSTAILLLGGGLIGLLLPLRADLEGFSAIEIGTLGGAYYGGLMLGCFLAPALIGRVGHIRCFAASTALATIAPLLHMLIVDPLAWTVLRIFQGICFAGLFTVIESWLSDAATSENRGRVLALYTVVHLSVATIGMQLIGLGKVASFELFAVVAILFSAAAVPVALTRTVAPTPPRTAGLHVRQLFAISPTALAGSLFAGLSNSAIWTMTPVFGRDLGLPPREAAVLLAVIVLSGAAGQWPVGWLSDRVGRRPVLIGLTLVAAAACAGIVHAAGHDRSLLLANGCLLGAVAFSMYPLSVAHANDLVPRERAVETSGGLLMVFSFAAVIGPLIASVSMTVLGDWALFLYLGVTHVLLVPLLVVRIGQRPTLPIEDKDGFVALARTTPAMFDLDPRSEGHGGT